MRIAVYSLRFSPRTRGGSHQNLFSTLTHLQERGCTTRLITLYSEDNDYQKAPCPTREEHFEGGFFALQRRAAELMHEEEADVHLIFGPSLLWAGGLYKRSGGTTPVAVHINNYTPGMGVHLPKDLFFMLKHRAWEKTFGRRLADAIDAFHFVAPPIRDFYREYGYARTSRTAIIPDLIDIKNIQSLPRYPAPFKKAHGTFHALYAGRFTRDKGVDLLLRAAIMLPPDIHVHFVGAGTEAEYLRGEIARAGVTGRVHLEAWKSPAEILGFFQHSDVFVLPARWPEPVARSVIEAIAHSLPIVTTVGTGAAWVAEGCGLTFKKDDAEGLARCIERLANEDDLRATLSTRAAVRAREFDYRNTIENFMAELQALQHTTGVC